MKRVGLGGQAGEMRGETNAVGVATKWTPSTNPGAYFSDRLIKKQKTIINGDLMPVVKALKVGRIVIWPSDGIGSGLSEVSTRSPETWKHLVAVQQFMEQI